MKYVFSLPDVKGKRIGLLSRNLCQDPLENYFGCQRQCGGTSDNPNAHEFGKNTESLRVVNSFCRGPVRGNCRGAGESDTGLDSATPLTRRRKVKTAKRHPSVCKESQSKDG